MIRRSRLVYGLLLAAWGIIVVWQAIEHERVRDAARTALINRSRDIASTLGLVVRSQRRFGMVSQERLESALNELVKSGELSSVALLNAAGEVVVSAGAPLNLEAKEMIQQGVRWETGSVTLVNLLDLGTTVPREGQTNAPVIVLPRREPTGSERDGERPRPPPPGPPPEEPRRAEVSATSAPSSAAGTNSQARSGRERRGQPWRGFGRPPWMNEADYKSLLETRGLHGLMMVMQTETFRRASAQDLFMRWIIGGLATVSVLGLGLAWRNLVQSSQLQMRLLRASEMNAHLKEMNLAAAGLAHETRNPLNIIRGLAQIISKQDDLSPEIRRRTREIIDETDRVTAQLNEFINYSRPREVRRAPVSVGAVITEVVRALNYDIEDKQIRLSVTGEQLTVEADEQLLRQALFNLLLNAIQAADGDGEIQIAVTKQDATEAALEVRDNGPGVPPEHRTDIFKPYFTTTQNGTGLGLAVVQQIVLAHGWEIVCLPNAPKGAVFRLTHLRLAAKAPEHAA
jgi:signal transduction histidine kinase